VVCNRKINGCHKKWLKRSDSILTTADGGQRKTSVAMGKDPKIHIETPAFIAEFQALNGLGVNPIKQVSPVVVY
jgi:hypothetical protein